MLEVLLNVACANRAHLRSCMNGAQTDTDVPEDSDFDCEMLAMDERDRLGVADYDWFQPPCLSLWQIGIETGSPRNENKPFPPTATDTESENPSGPKSKLTPPVLKRSNAFGVPVLKRSNAFGVPGVRDASGTETE